MNKNVNIFKKILLPISILIFSSGLSQYAGAAHHGAHDNHVDPLKILMITGGGPWHDYATQKDQIKGRAVGASLQRRESQLTMKVRDTLTMGSTDFEFLPPF